MGILRSGAVRAVERIDVAAEADERVLEHLVRLGCDLRSPRATTHYVYLSTRDHASRVGEVLQRDGWLTRLEPCVDDSWLVVADRACLLSSASVRETRRTFEALAAEHGGIYDGWEARVD